MLRTATTTITRDVAEGSRTEQSVDAESAVFLAWYREFADPIYRYCYRRLSSKEAAEDMTQLVFEKALKAFPRFRRDSSPKTWLFTIAHNTLVDHYRTRHPAKPLDEVRVLVDHAPSIEEVVLNREESRSLHELMEHLSEQERTLLELRLAGLNDREIAEVTGKSHGAVRTMQYRTVMRLRTMMGLDALEDENSHAR